MTDTYDKENHWYGWNGGEWSFTLTDVERCSASEMEKV
jgi:hypothetical protein